MVAYDFQSLFAKSLSDITEEACMMMMVLLSINSHRNICRVDIHYTMILNGSYVRRSARMYTLMVPCYHMQSTIDTQEHLQK